MLLGQTVLTDNTRNNYLKLQMLFSSAPQTETRSCYCQRTKVTKCNQTMNEGKGGMPNDGQSALNMIYILYMYIIKTYHITRTYMTEAVLWIHISMIRIRILFLFCLHIKTGIRIRLWNLLDVELWIQQARCLMIKILIPSSSVKWIRVHET